MNAVEKFIVQDLEVMSDFDIHKTCLHYRVRYYYIYMKLISITVEGYRKYETYRVNDCRSKFCVRK